MATFISPSSLAHLGPTMSPEHAALRRKDQDIVELVARSQILTAELEKERTARQEVERKMEKRERGWKEGTELIQQQYQTVQLQYRLALSEERLREMNDQHSMLQMKIANTIRDHRLSRFQTRETELTWEIQDLTEEADEERKNASERLEEALEELESVKTDLGKKLAKVERLKSAGEGEVEEARKAAQDVQTHVDHLQVKHSALEAQHRKTSLSLQRVQLELDTLKAQEKELKSRMSDWQTLEKKSDKELDKLGEAKAALEVRVRELERDVAEGKLREKGMEKERKRLESMERKVERLEELLAKAQDQTSEAQEEAHKAQTELGKVQKQLGRVQAQTTRDTSVLPGGSHKPASSTTTVEEPEPRAAPKPRPKPRKLPPRSPPGSDAESDQEASDYYDNLPGRGKRKPASTAGQKRKAAEKEKPKPREKPIQEEDEKENDGPAISGSTFPTSFAAPPAQAKPAREEEDQGKKKKRKLFGAPGAAPFQWAAGLNTGDGVDSIIPSILSPIKGGGPAPQRAGVRALGLTSGRSIF